MATYKVDITGINTSQLISLTHEENIELFKQMHNGSKLAKEKLINGNLKLVLSILKKFNKPNINMDDLFQVGVIGLIKAIDNFDINYNLKLSTYAVPLILGEIKKYIRDNLQLRVSRSIKENAYNILKYKEEYFNKYGIEPTSKQISNVLSLSEYDIAFALDSLKEPSSIFEPVFNDGTDTIFLQDQIKDTKFRTDNDELIALNKALKQIKPREREILIKRFIIGKTQAEIANNMQISQAQVSRIEKSAIGHVRRLVR